MTSKMKKKSEIIPNGILLYILRDLCLIQLSSERLSNRWKWEPRERYYAEWDLNWRSPSSPSLVVWGISCRRWGRDCRNQRTLRLPGEHGSLNKQSRACVDSDTEVSAMGLAMFSTKSSAFMLLLLAGDFLQKSLGASRYISEHLAALETFFSPIGLPSPALIRGPFPCLMFWTI